MHLKGLAPEEASWWSKSEDKMPCPNLSCPFAQGLGQVLVVLSDQI
jgi:hypothetical protein